MNDIKTNTEQEISRVLGDLGALLADRFTQAIMEKVLLIQFAIHTKSKYFRVKKLVPLIIYVFLTLRDVRINKSDLIRVSEIFNREFNCFFHQLRNYMLIRYGGDNYV